MSARHEIEQRLETWRDLEKILGSLKTLASLEIRKLQAVAASQADLMHGVERALRTLLRHTPRLRTGRASNEKVVVIVIGSERGFCGELNRTLAELAMQRPACHRVLVGRRLWSRFPPAVQGRSELSGAATLDEIGTRIRELVELLIGLPDWCGCTLEVLRFPPGTREPECLTVFPPSFEEDGEGERSELHLTLPPDELLNHLLHEHLTATLFGVFSGALLSENERRLAHLQAALDHLERTRQRLELRQNALRQEEITEELQLILLNYRPPTG